MTANQHDFAPEPFTLPRCQIGQVHIARLVSSTLKAGVAFFEALDQPTGLFGRAAQRCNGSPRPIRSGQIKSGHD